MQATTNNLDKLLAGKNSLTQQIIKGKASENIVEFGSQGLLPIPRYEIIEVLIFLITNDSPNKQNATKTLGKTKPADLIEVLKRPDLMPGVYEYFAEAKKYNKQIIQTLLYNRAVPNSVFEKIAEEGSEDLLEIIVTNQVRLLNCPPIIERLLRNDNLSGDQKRRLIEFREEFFEKVSVGNPLFRGLRHDKEKEEELRPEEQMIMEPEHVVRPELSTELPTMENFRSGIQKDKEEHEAEAEAEEAAVAQEELSEEEITLAPTALTEEEKKSEKMMGVFNKIMKLTVPEKIQLALLGSREERSILIRDNNKQVSGAVLKSPKLTEIDVEIISTFRQVDPEILQGIAANKKWMRNYMILLNLVKNPKTPQGVAMNLLNRVTITDLKILKMNRNVPEYIRKVAQRKIVEKSSSRTG